MGRLGGLMFMEISELVGGIGGVIFRGLTGGEITVGIGDRMGRGMSKVLMS